MKRKVHTALSEAGACYVEVEDLIDRLQRVSERLDRLVAKNVLPEPVQRDATELLFAITRAVLVLAKANS